MLTHEYTFPAFSSLTADPVQMREFLQKLIRSDPSST